MAVTISSDKVKKVCYVVGAGRERTPRATKIGQALKAEIIDCPSKLKRYSTFPIVLSAKLTFSSYDLVIVNNIPTHVLFCAWIASKFRGFILVADFVNFWEYAVRKKFKWLSGFASRFEKWIYRRLRYGLAINEVIANHARTAGVAKVKVVYDAADHEFFKPSFNSDPVVVLAANLRKDEGVDVLLRAMKTVKENVPLSKCLLAGTGEEEEHLRRLANDLMLGSHIEFLGWIQHSEMPRIYERASIGVIPMRSVSPLALPIKLFEYMSSGLAVISTDTNTIRTIIEPRKNGLLFQPEDSDALASLITQVLLNRSLMSSLQRAARATVDAGLNWKTEAEKLTIFVSDIVSEKRA